MKKNYCLLALVLLFLLVVSGCHKNQEPAEHIPVVMRKYSIEPAVIRVKAGQRVALEVSSLDVQHGLDIPDLGIKEAVRPGQPATVIFVAPAKGEYKIVCGVVCGPHHDDMMAKLVVE